MLLVLPFAVLVGVAVFVALVAFRSEQPAPKSARGALVWGNGIFATRAELKAWLQQHGASYDVWLAKHPQASGYVGRATARPAREVPKTASVAARARGSAKPAAKKSGVLAAKATLTQPVAATTSGSGPSRLLTIIFGIFVVLALGASAVPDRYLMRNGQVMVTPETRIFVAAAGIATLLGVAAALWIR